jgi:hypothetical protein
MRKFIFAIVAFLFTISFIFVLRNLGEAPPVPRGEAVGALTEKDTFRFFRSKTDCAPIEVGRTLMLVGAKHLPVGRWKIVSAIRKDKGFRVCLQNEANPNLELSTFLYEGAEPFYRK